jgi:AcrR family transcriptional regulator
MGRGGTRERIVRAATELFWAKGYGSTSIADILGRTQLNSGSLYHFFPAKQDLLVAVLDAYREGIEPMLLEPAWAGEPDPVERIFRLLDAYRANIVATDCSYGCPIGSLALELHEADPAVRERLARNFAAWVGAVRGCFQEASDRFPEGTDFHALAELTLSVMEGGVMQARTHRDVGYFDRGVAQLRRYVSCLTGMNQKGSTP